MERERSLFRPRREAKAQTHPEPVFDRSDVVNYFSSSHMQSKMTSQVLGHPGLCCA